jgi:hypothetical protein
MDLFRVTVTPRGNGYIAQSKIPKLTALGASAEEAAENARVMALERLGADERPPMLLVRVHDVRCRTIVMQPIDRPVQLDAARRNSEWRTTGML